MDILSAIILGFVEGITEFLPISSTGHLILASDILHLEQTGFMKSFEIAIQSGAVLAVLFLYWKSFLNVEIMKRVFTAFIPTSIVGLALYKIFKQTLLGSSSIVVWSLLAGGIFFILFELFHKKKSQLDDISKIPYIKCFAIGLFQSISIIPGISRSGASIIGGLFMGLRRDIIIQFSFLLAVPTLIAASAFDLYQSYSQISNFQPDILLIGIITSFISAIAAIKFFIGFVKKHTFIPFGLYRIAVALAFLLIV